jgi:hypothetical protein
MKKIKKLLAVVLFLLQVIFSLLVYMYSAHLWRLSITVAIAVAGTIMCIQTFDKLFRSSKVNIPKIQRVTSKKAEVRLISRRKKISI